MTCTMDNKRINLHSTIVALLLIHIAEAQVCNPPCQNGGSCTGTKCQCDGVRYTGMYCELMISDTCDPNPCMNGGICTLAPESTKGYTCNCQGTGYTGGACERVADGTGCTTSDDCNGGVCNNGMCDCSGTDYFGMNCEHKKAIVGFESTEYSFGEGDGGEVVYVTRTFGYDLETTITVTATPLGDTEDGVDYSFAPNPMTVTFPAGYDIKIPINLEILNDDILEGDELFELRIRVPDKATTRVAGSMRITNITIRASDGGISESQDCNLGGMSECLNMGTCNSDGKCMCTDAWMGNRCEYPHACYNVQNPPCLNGGECVRVTGDPHFVCTCPATFTGARCNVPVPPDNGDDGETSPQGGLGTTTTIAIAVVAIIVVLVAFIVVVVYCKRRGQSKKDYSSGQSDGSEDGRGSQKANTYVPSAHFRNQPRGGKRHATVYDKSERKIGAEFPREKLKLHEHLGSGAFANVVRADAMGIVKRGVKTVVAVKMLKEGATESDRSDFSKELKVYRMLEPNPNIIVMLGCCTEKDPFYLIMEYAPNGNLQSHLRGIRNAPVSPYNNINATDKNFLAPGEVLDFATQIANGMKYLASKQCIHRDLATRNVLLGDGLVCKLSDFGLARDISEQTSYEMKSRGRVPVRWMAPESLLENTYTSKSDVWSFAVTMWELLTVGSHPYPGMSSKRVIADLQKGYRLPKPEHCSNEIYAMMMECWHERSEKRPSFSQIHRKLENMLEDAQGYLVMSDFNAAGYVYLDHDHQSDSSVENGEHGDATGAV